MLEIFSRSEVKVQVRGETIVHKCVSVIIVDAFISTSWRRDSTKADIMVFLSIITDYIAYILALFVILTAVCLFVFKIKLKLN